MESKGTETVAKTAASHESAHLAALPAGVLLSQHSLIELPEGMGSHEHLQAVSRTLVMREAERIGGQSVR